MRTNCAVGRAELTFYLLTAQASASDEPGFPTTLNSVRSLWFYRQVTSHHTSLEEGKKALIAWISCELLKGNGQRNDRGRVHTDRRLSLEDQVGIVYAALVPSNIRIHILFGHLAVKRSYFLLPQIHRHPSSGTKANSPVRASSYCGLTARISSPMTHTATDISAKLVCSNGRATAAGPSDRYLLSLPFCKAAYRSVPLSHTYVFLLAMLPPEYTLF